MWERETECLHSIILSVSVGSGDLFIEPIDTTCMLGKGTCNHYYCVCLCMGREDRVPAHNNTTCVNVREGES